MNAIIGRKISQAQEFLADGSRVPVTVVSVEDNVVLAVKTAEKHGYSAVQLGYGARKNSTKPLAGQTKELKLKDTPLLIREVLLKADEVLPNAGEFISAEAVFKPGDIVRVSGTSKGKGFAGVVKRHNFKGGPRTHGQSDRERAPGSIGQTTTPGRVYRGKRMAGRMGNEKTTILNLQIVSIENEQQKKRVFIKGLVPGSVNSLLLIEKTGELPEKKIKLLARLVGQKAEQEKITEAKENNPDTKETA